MATGKNSASGPVEQKCFAGLPSPERSRPVKWRSAWISSNAKVMARGGYRCSPPVGMYLPNSVKLAIDHGKPHRVPYTWCLTNACIAGIVASPPLINEMNAGKTMRLEFVDSNLMSLVTSLPLGQFAIAYKGAPAQTLEQDIDE